MPDKRAKNRTGYILLGLARRNCLVPEQRPKTPSWWIVGEPTLNTPDLKILAGIRLCNNEPVFSQPWEAQAFALVIGLHEKGFFEWTEWAETLSKTIHSDDGTTPYYELWFMALETIVGKKSLTNKAEIEKRKSDWQRALLATPHGEPIRLENSKAD